MSDDFLAVRRGSMTVAKALSDQMPVLNERPTWRHRTPTRLSSHHR
ncbi:hypothetical protein ACWEKM_20595 [Streptomyces sp. NPDC004752]